MSMDLFIVYYIVFPLLIFGIIIFGRRIIIDSNFHKHWKYFDTYYIRKVISNNETLYNVHKRRFYFFIGVLSKYNQYKFKPMIKLTFDFNGFYFQTYTEAYEHLEKYLQEVQETKNKEKLISNYFKINNKNINKILDKHKLKINDEK